MSPASRARYSMSLTCPLRSPASPPTLIGRRPVRWFRSNGATSTSVVPALVAGKHRDDGGGGRNGCGAPTSPLRPDEGRVLRAHIAPLCPGGGTERCERASRLVQLVHQRQHHGHTVLLDVQLVVQLE